MPAGTDPKEEFTNLERLLNPGKFLLLIFHVYVTPLRRRLVRRPRRTQTGAAGRAARQVSRRPDSGFSHGSLQRPEATESKESKTKSARAISANTEQCLRILY